MDFAQQQRNPAKHFAGMAFVVMLHVAVVYALVTGLSRKIVEVVRAPIETKIIEELKKPPPPDVPPPPPPKLAVAPPPPYIPPPEVQIQQPPPQENVISAVTTVKPETPTPPPVAGAPAAGAVAPISIPPVIDAARSCKTPEYPAASRRAEETGTVTLRFLIDVNGRVIESRVESSSGYRRLDDAARQALSLCGFKPGTVDGKPVRSWARLQYEWKLE